MKRRKQVSILPAQREQCITFGTQPECVPEFYLLCYFIFCHVQSGKPDIFTLSGLRSRKLLAHIADILFHILRPGSNIENWLRGAAPSCWMAQSGKHAIAVVFPYHWHPGKARDPPRWYFERDIIHCRERHLQLPGGSRGVCGSNRSSKCVILCYTTYYGRTNR